MVSLPLFAPQPRPGHNSIGLLWTHVEFPTARWPLLSDVPYTFCLSALYQTDPLIRTKDLIIQTETPALLEQPLFPTLNFI